VTRGSSNTVQKMELNKIKSSNIPVFFIRSGSGNDKNTSSILINVSPPLPALFLT